MRRANVIVGNSSAGLIEGAALGRWCVNVGSRQAGRETPPNVTNVPRWDIAAIEAALERAMASPPPPPRHPYGDGRTGARVAEWLASFDPDRYPLAKRNTY
jgi:UDP-N-acetylglucosamine 2-epimerase